MSRPGAGRSPALAARFAGLAVCVVLATSIALAGAAGGAGQLAAPSADPSSTPVPTGAVPTGAVPTGAVPTGAGDLSVAEIGTVALAAGFRGPALVMAIAVALAESGGNPLATDYDSNKTVDRGLWQINSIHGQFSPRCDYDPRCAAEAAFVVSDGGRNWEPWVTWRHGTEIAYLPAAAAFLEQGAHRPVRNPSPAGEVHDVHR